ncbi:MAG: hypothetical protein IPO81_14775 [Kouleothrix sp.]|nr:hypothetical protein [Kouleothrix sp.]
MTTTASPLTPPSPAELRAELERLVLLDLLGPAGGAEEEIAERSVRDRYLVGMLAPRQQQIAPEEHADLNQAGEDAPDDGPIDRGVSQAPSMFPRRSGSPSASTAPRLPSRSRRRGGATTASRANT